MSSDSGKRAPAQKPVIESFEALQAEFDKVYLLEDRGIVRVLCATVIANKLDLDPVWLFLVGPSSGGKTAMIDAIEGLDFVHPIDTMTVNTFASGQSRAGKETSLLLRINDGIITYKDFTAILEMNKDARKEIMGQLRCIFDGKFVKRTGTGDDIRWEGKLGMIAAVTSVINNRSEEFSTMGERFIQYSIAQPDRREMAKRMFSNAHGMDAKRKAIRDAAESYIGYVYDRLQDDQAELSDEDREELLEIADYSTLARSGLEKDQRDSSRIRFVPDPEMPTRVMGQLITLASALMAMNRAEKGSAAPKEQLTKEDKALICKIALDSIPRKRRHVLRNLAAYSKGITTAGVAIAMRYNTDVIRETLFELNALGFCTRKRDGGTDLWQITESYRDVILKYEGLTALDEALEAKDDVEDYTEAFSDANDAWGVLTNEF